MADTEDLKSSGLTAVRVRLPPRLLKPSPEESGRPGGSWTDTTHRFGRLNARFRAPPSGQIMAENRTDRPFPFVHGKFSTTDLSEIDPDLSASLYARQEFSQRLSTFYSRTGACVGLIVVVSVRIPDRAPNITLRLVRMVKIIDGNAFPVRALHSARISEVPTGAVTAQDDFGPPRLPFVF